MSDKTELLERVNKAVDTVRPYLKTDGGDVKIVEVTDEYIVIVELLGSCETCPMSPMTMKNGIEQAIKKSVPEIKGVQAINKMTTNS